MFIVNFIIRTNFHLSTINYRKTLIYLRFMLECYIFHNKYAESAIYGICRPIMQTLCHVSHIVRNLCGMAVTLTKIYIFAASYFGFRHF